MFETHLENHKKMESPTPRNVSHVLQGLFEGAGDYDLIIPIPVWFINCLDRGLIRRPDLPITAIGALICPSTASFHIFHCL